MAGMGGMFDQAAGGVGNIVGSYFSAQAAKKAQAAKEAALAALEEQNIAKTNALVQQYDKSSYQGRLNLLKETDPSAYAAYMKAGGQMADIASDKYGNIAKAQDAANQAYLESIHGQPGLNEAERLAAEQSADMLAQGGRLSPEQQAELMRAGFSVGSGIGGVAGSDAQRSGMARRLVSDQLAMQQQREQMSANLAAQSQGIRANRNNILAGLGLQQQNTALGQQNIANNANAFAGSRMPTSYGLSGHDAGDLDVQNTNLRNQVRLAQAGAAVEGINARLAATNQLIGGVSNTASAGGKMAMTGMTGGAAGMFM